MVPRIAPYVHPHDWGRQGKGRSQRLGPFFLRSDRDPGLKPWGTSGATVKAGQKQGPQQIPCGNDRQRGKSHSRFPAGMTDRGATATTMATATAKTRTSNRRFLGFARNDKHGARNDKHGARNDKQGGGLELVGFGAEGGEEGFGGGEGVEDVGGGEPGAAELGDAMLHVVEFFGGVCVGVDDDLAA